MILQRDGNDWRLSCRYGQLDCVINNGAIGGGMVPLHAKDLKEYSSIMDIK